MVAVSTFTMVLYLTISKESHREKKSSFPQSIGIENDGPFETNRLAEELNRETESRCDNIALYVLGNLVSQGTICRLNFVSAADNNLLQQFNHSSITNRATLFP